MKTWVSVLSAGNTQYLKVRRMRMNDNKLNKLLDSVVPTDEGLKVNSDWDNLELEEHMRSVARLTKIKYDMLVEQGFSKTEALELCKNLFSGIR